MEPKTNDTPKAPSEVKTPNQVPERNAKSNESNDSISKKEEGETVSALDLPSKREQTEEYPTKKVQEEEGGGSANDSRPVWQVEEPNDSQCESQVQEKGPRRGRKREKKIAKCRAPSSSYLQFSNAVRNSIHRQLEEEGESPTSRQVTQRTTAVWKQLTANEKEFWEDLFRQRRENRLRREEKKKARRNKVLDHEQESEAAGASESMTETIMTLDCTAPSYLESSDEEDESINISDDDLNEFLLSLSDVRYRSIVSELGLKEEKMDEETVLDTSDVANTTTTKTHTDDEGEKKELHESESASITKSYSDSRVQGHECAAGENADSDSANVVQAWQKKSTHSPLGLPTPNEVLRIWKGRTCYKDKSYFDDKVSEHEHIVCQAEKDDSATEDEVEISPKVLLNLLRHQPEIKTILFKHRFGQTAKKAQRKARQKRIQKKKEKAELKKILRDQTTENNEEDETDNVPPITVEGGDVEAVEGGDAKLFEGGDVKLVEGGDVEAVEGGDVEAVEGGDVEAVEEGDVDAVEGGDVETVEGGDVKLVEGGDVKLVEGGDVKQVEGGDVKLVEGGDVKLVEGGDVDASAETAENVPAASRTSPIDGLLVPFSQRRSKKPAADVADEPPKIFYGKVHSDEAPDESFSAPPKIFYGKVQSKEALDESSSDEEVALTEEPVQEVSADKAIAEAVPSVTGENDHTGIKSLLDFKTLTVTFVEKNSTSKSKRKGLRSRKLPFKISRTVKWRCTEDSEDISPTRILPSRSAKLKRNAYLKRRIKEEDSENESVTTVCPSTLKKPPKTVDNKKRKHDGDIATPKERTINGQAFRPVRATEEYFKHNREKVRKLYPDLSFNERRKILFSLWYKESTKVQNKFYAIAREKTLEKEKAMLESSVSESPQAKIEDKSENPSTTIAPTVEHDAKRNERAIGMSSSQERSKKRKKSRCKGDKILKSGSTNHHTKQPLVEEDIPIAEEKEEERSENDGSKFSCLDDTIDAKNGTRIPPAVYAAITGVVDKFISCNKDLGEYSENNGSLPVEPTHKEYERFDKLSSETFSHSCGSGENNNTPLPPAIFDTDSDRHSPSPLVQGQRRPTLGFKDPNTNWRKIFDTSESESSKTLKLSLPAHMYNYDPLAERTDRSTHQNTDLSSNGLLVPQHVSTNDPLTETEDHPKFQDMNDPLSRECRNGLGLSPMFSPSFTVEHLRAPKLMETSNDAKKLIPDESNPLQDANPVRNASKGIALICAAAFATESKNFLSPLVSQEPAPIAQDAPYVTPEDAAVAGVNRNDPPTSADEDTSMLELSQGILAIKLDQKPQEKGVMSPETVSTLSLPPLMNMFSPFVAKKDSKKKDVVS